MLFDGVTLAEGTAIENLTCAVGTVDPSNPSEGELFFRTDLGTLRVYDGSAWQDVASGSLGSFTITGDVTGTINGGTDVLTLATVNSNTGSFGSSTAIPVFTVNGKGLITAAATAAVVAPASTLTGTTLASNVVTSSLTSVGTITSGTWNGTTIAIANGGTGQTSAANAINALLPTQTGNSGKYLTTNGSVASWATVSGGGGGSGTVTDVSVVSANGFAGTVADSTTEPEITISTTVTGLLKGNGTAISAATAGTDYSAGTAALGTGILKSTTGTGALTIAVAGDFPTLNQNTTGSAASLTTARNINGVAFNGTGDITVTAAAGTLTGTALNSSVVTSSLTSVGTLAGVTIGGNTTVTGSTRRLRANFSDSTISNRLYVQTSVTDDVTAFGLIPNGTGAFSSFVAHDGADPDNSAFIAITSGASNLARINSDTTGSGTLQPLVLAVDLNEYLRISTTGNVSIGNAALATNATDGFLYISSSAGAPTGTPTTVTGRAPIHVDTTNNRLYFRSGGAWRALFENGVGSAATLSTARNINGVSFNGSADITVTAAAGTLTGTTLNSSVVTSSLTSVGTITSGTWTGTTIAIANGGTGQTSAANAINALLPSQTSNAGKLLLTNGSVASWASDLIWDNTNKRLGIQVASPAQALQVGDGTVAASSAHYLRVFSAGADLYIGQSQTTVFGVATGTIGLLLQDAAHPMGVGTTSNQSLIFGTNNTERFRISNTGVWTLAGAAGSSGQVLTSNGSGSAPTWQSVGSGAITPTSIDVTGPVRQNITAVAASAVDCSAGNYFTKTASGALTWTATNVPSTRFFSFILKLTNGGTGAQTWFSGTKWSGGSAPTLAASGIDILGFFTDDGGTTWYGQLIAGATA